MEKKDPDYRQDYDPSDDETSGYLLGDSNDDVIDLGGLFSNRFSNIKTFYSSSRGATQLYTATRYGKRFVLKGLKDEFRNDPLLNLALAKEFEIGLALEHPNIRRTLSLEAVEGIGQVIVLEHIDGQSLESMLKTGVISPDLGRSICRQLAEAMEYLHGKQAVHRDLKPSNILVTHQGSIVKIIDFNLSDSDDFIILKNPAGSGKYMAPEQLNVDARPTPEADIYSLGVVAGEIAGATGDSRLGDAAEKCRDAVPARRLTGLRLLKEAPQRISIRQILSGCLSSAWLTYMLAALCIALAAFIANHYLSTIP